MGLEKNSRKFASQALSGESVNVIPDAVQDGAMQVIVMEKTSIFISNIELEEQGLEKD